MMTGEKMKNKFADLLKIFGEQNESRLTRLGVFIPENDTMQDYWLEDGLPLAGIGTETDGEINVEIMLGKEGDERHLTHSVKNVKSVKIELSLEAGKDGLEITDAGGKVTILRFENNA